MIICGCQIIEQLHEGATAAVYRGRRADGLAVVLKTIKEERPAPATVVRLRHEYALLRGLDADGIIRTHGLEEDQGRWALVLEDFGGTSLKDLRIAGKLSIPDFLALAIELTDIVNVIHQRRIVHKDINPSNLLMNPATRRIKLIDFGISTVLPRETLAYGGPGGLDGTLAYMSPEQTGRMNRSLDYRTDFYSLGVTLYELLSGRKPFESDDPLELVHCHIAREPSSPFDGIVDSPKVVADIVLKLMAKSADDRYQSARGLRADLVTCLDELRQKGAIDSFPLGRHDESELFRFPQRLYGREQELRCLLDGLENVSGGGATLITVSGYAGIGKTALIQEVYRPLTLRRGYFVAGKFEQNRTGIPYGAPIQALQALIQQILTESEEQIAAWRQQIFAALGANTRVLIDVCPAIERITGPQPELPALSPADSRNRFSQAICAFISVFAAALHPLCIFLDDLQWAEVDSLKLIDELLQSAKNLPLLLIGAYRDNEVNEAHPLTLGLKMLAERAARVERIVLSPLGSGEVEAMVMDTLFVPQSQAAPLADLLLARTGGNPFFVRSFLTSIHADGLLESTQDGWRWDIERIRQRGVTDNVVDLLVDRVKRLPQTTQDMLKLAACIGNQFDLGTLAIAAGRSGGETGGDLWDAVAEGLLISLDKVHSAVEIAITGPFLHFRFAHDRIQQAVISTIDPSVRPRLHSNVGRRLLRRASENELERDLFEIVGQLNQGRPAVRDQAELDELAHLNLRAARKVLKVGGARQALDYAMAGVSMLRDDDWRQRYELALDLHCTGAEAALPSADFETLERLSEIVLLHARNVLDELRIRKLEGLVHLSKQQLVQASQTYLLALERLGFALPKDPTPADAGAEMLAVVNALANHPIESIVDLTVCANPEARAAIEILNQLLQTAGFTLANLFPIVVCRLVALSLQYGNLPESCLGYVMYGTFLTHGNNIDDAYRFGRMALELADRTGDKGLRSQAYLFVYFFLIHWKVPLYDLYIPFSNAYQYGLEARSPFNASIGALNLCLTRFLAGSELGGLTSEMRRYAEVIVRFHQTQARTSFEVYQQAAINLHEDSSEPWKLAGRVYDEEKRVAAQRAANDAGGLFNYYYCKTLLCFIFGEFALSVASADANQPYLMGMATGLHAAPWALLDSLSRLAVYPAASADEQAKILAAVAGNLAKLESWLTHCPQSYEHKLRLIEAERAHVLGERNKAAAAFTRAVELAHKSGYVHEEAIACELAGRFHLGGGDGKLARSCLRQAQQAYLRWGAVNKVKALERQYPHLIPRAASSTMGETVTATSTSEGDFNLLDVISVLDASQAISREVALDRLLVRLMELLLESSGAEAGCLLMERDGHWLVEAEKTADREATVMQSLPIADLEAHGGRALPVAVINYVARTQDSVLLDDAAASPQFGQDPCVVKRKLRSVLCFPLGQQGGGRRGIVYLENSLIRGAFTAGRTRVLQMLSTQAVISLENAELYKTLERKVQDRTQQLSAKNAELGAALSRLHEAQDRLLVQERLASLGSLSIGIAHELRNPLNFVTNFADLSVGLVREIGEGFDALQVRPIPAPLAEAMQDLQENLARISEHGQRMDRIIGSMLEHSRSSHGERENTDLNALVKQYVRLGHQGQRSRVPSLDVAVELDLDAKVGTLSLVPQDISRVVLNLFDNACYAVQAKQRALGKDHFSPRIDVSTRDLGARVEIRVRDNGTGIPEEARGQIFTPFFTTKPTGQGTGLGLSISHDIIVKGNGGSLDFASRAGEFSEFIVTLPRWQDR